MSEKPAGGRSVEEVLDLLTDPEFCADARRTIKEAAAIAEQATNPQDWQLRVEPLGKAFLERWGVPPPTSGELLDSDPRRRFVDAMASGRWGLVLVVPRTTNGQIRATIKKIRSVVRKRHRDALITRHAQLVGWLETIGFDRPTIARSVFGRRTGLRRPTTAQVIARSERRERQLYDHYRGLGLTREQIQQKIYRTLRGSEALASAAVRMTTTRQVKRFERLNQDLATPVQSEPLSYALTMLFRALPDADDAMVRHLTIVVREALVDAFVPPLTTAKRIEAPSQQQPFEAIVSGRWGIIPVFPWTTDPNLRASIKGLRAMMRPRPQDGPDPAPAARPIPFEPLSDGLISLFQALTQENVVVRRHAFETRAILLQTGAS